MQASRLSQGAPLSQHALAAPEAAAPPSVAAAIAVNQALDAEPPTLCLQLDSTTLPELLPLQDPTPLVSHPGTCSRAAWGGPTMKSACSSKVGSHRSRGASLQRQQPSACSECRFCWPLAFFLML